MTRLIVWLVALTVLFACLSWMAHRSRFFPMRYPEGDWTAAERLGATDVQLVAADGVQLHAWYKAEPGARVVTLFLHGNAGNVTHRARSILAATAAGSAILVPDYRGYGKSEGSPSEAGLYRDADAAYNWLLAQGWKPDQIILHGESLGTAVAVDLAARKPSAGAILEAPFPSAKAVAGTVLPLVGPVLISGFDSASKIGAIRVPLLFIQGDRDEVIAPSLGRALYDAAPTPKDFFVVAGAGHNDIPEAGGRAYANRLKAFYDQTVP